MENNFVFNDAQENEEFDEAISLIDFPMSPYPLDIHHTSNDFSSFQDFRSPSDDQSEFFEFSKEFNNMSQAENINFCGKLIPINNQNQNPTKQQNITAPPSKSSPDLKTSTNPKKKLRTSLSFDSDSSDIRSSSSSSSSAQSSSRFDGYNIKNPKPSWYIMLFGSLSMPREMDIRDIKNRQVRRTPSAPIYFPATEAVKKPQVNRKRSWGVLKALSCRNYGSVRVTTSLACMPRV